MSPNWNGDGARRTGKQARLCEALSQGVPGAGGEGGSGRRAPTRRDRRGVGISPDSVLRWVKQADPDAWRRRDGLSTSERQELAQLRRDNRPLRMER